MHRQPPYFRSQNHPDRVLTTIACCCQNRVPGWFSAAAVRKRSKNTDLLSCFLLDWDCGGGGVLGPTRTISATKMGTNAADSLQQSLASLSRAACECSLSFRVERLNFSSGNVLTGPGKDRNSESLVDFQGPKWKGERENSGRGWLGRRLRCGRGACRATISTSMCVRKRAEDGVFILRWIFSFFVCFFDPLFGVFTQSDHPSTAVHAKTPLRQFCNRVV